ANLNSVSGFASERIQRWERKGPGTRSMSSPIESQVPYAPSAVPMFTYAASLYLAKTMIMNRRDFNRTALYTIGAYALHRPQSTIRVNGQRVNDHLRELSEFGKNPQGGVSRLAYSEADLKGREYAMGLMRGAK